MRDICSLKPTLYQFQMHDILILYIYETKGLLIFVFFRAYH